MGIAITAFDTLLVLGLQGAGFRRVEAIVLGLVLTIAGCFVVELAMSQPNWFGVAMGFVPSLERLQQPGALYLAIGRQRGLRVKRKPQGVRLVGLKHGGQAAQVGEKRIGWCGAPMRPCTWRRSWAGRRLRAPIPPPVCNDSQPTGIATNPAKRPASGTKAKSLTPPVRFKCVVIFAKKYAPLP